MGDGQKSLLTNLMVSSIPRTHKVEKKNWFAHLCSELHTCAHGVTCTHIIHVIFKLKVLCYPKHKQLCSWTPLLLSGHFQDFFSSLRGLSSAPCISSLCSLSLTLYTLYLLPPTSTLSNFLSLGHFYQPSNSNSSSSPSGIHPSGSWLDN